jgi:hypothetical protein
MDRIDFITHYAAHKQELRNNSHLPGIRISLHQAAEIDTIAENHEFTMSRLCCFEELITHNRFTETWLCAQAAQNYRNLNGGPHGQC